MDQLTEQLRELVQNEGMVTASKRILYHGLVRTPLQVLPMDRLPPWAVQYGYTAQSLVSRHSSDAEPLRLVLVDPNAIEYTHTTGHPTPPTQFGRVVGGDWDRNKVPTATHYVYQSVRHRYETDVCWDETALYEEHVHRISDGDPQRGPQTMEELEKECSDLDELLATIEAEGYKSQRELLQECPTDTRALNNDTFHPMLNEVSVNIDRNGEFIKCGSGTHRLAVAQALSLKEIPVLIRTRHAKWQAIRDKIRTADTATDLRSESRSYLSHPDLADIIPNRWIQ